jgi:RNA polymerase sigma factor (sigma-70 family)
LSNPKRTPEASLTLVRSAVEGDRAAVRRLVAELTPAIRASVASVLFRASSSRRDPGQEVEDVTQTVLLSLFADRGHALLQWDPSRGLDLEGFVRLLARRETTSILRSRRRNPFTERPTLQEDLDQNAVQGMGIESETISRDMLAALSRAVKDRLSPRGAELFDLMFMKGLPVDEVCAVTGLVPETVYTWKSRLARELREILDEIGHCPSSRPAALVHLKDVRRGR